MKKDIIINVSLGETRAAILEDNALVELYVERPENERMVGDLYKGRVENIVDGIQAAFVDVGLEQNGFLPFSDVGTEFSVLAENVKKSDKKPKKPSRRQKFKSRSGLKVGQEILVQVTKEPIRSKGTRLTSAVSLPGRYLVLVPRDNMVGVSRKIKNSHERRRLRVLSNSIRPEGFGLIIRTVAMGKDTQTIGADLDNLKKSWKKIEDKYKTQKDPGLLHKDMGLTSSVIRDLFSPDIDRLVIDSRKLYNEIKKYLKDVSPTLLSKLELYKEKTPIFDKFLVEEAIEKSMSRKIWMKGGGYIIFEHTEAFVVVDVNSGRSVSEKDHERNALKTDLAAARQIARQLRLRDIGGIIVIDFIDLLEEKNRRKVFAEIRKEMNKDRATFDVLPMSNFGLVQLTRERIRPSLLYRYSEPCSRCEGSGRVLTKSAIVTQIERKIQQIKHSTGQRRFVLRLHPDLADFMKEGVRSHVRDLVLKYLITLKLKPDLNLKEEEYELLTAKAIKK